MLQGFFVFVVFVCKRNVVNVILCRDVADESSKENEVAMQSLRENWNCRLYQQICSWSFSELWSIFQSPIPTQMAFTGVTYAHGSSPQPTACRSLSCSLMTVTGSNQALRQDLTYLAWEVWDGCGEQSFGMSDLSYFLWKVSGIQLINCLEVGPYPARLFSQPKFTRNILATIGKSVNTFEAHLKRFRVKAILIRPLNGLFWFCGSRSLNISWLSQFWQSSLDGQPQIVRNCGFHVSH